MQTKHLPRRPGIYRIINTIHGRAYVGSASDLQKRVLGHRQLLNKGTHPNKKLQRAWRKYGYAAFEAAVLEEVQDVSILCQREQAWIDLLGTHDDGYNLRPEAASNRGIQWSQKTIDLRRQTVVRAIPGYVMPDGAEVTILDVHKFCEQEELCAGAMYALASGRNTSYRGWTHANAKQPVRKWINTYNDFIDPEGREAGPIVNLQKFCEDRGLDPSCMSKVSRGVLRKHHGWTHKGYKPKPRTRVYTSKTVVGFVNPAGEPVSIPHMKRFCREHGLNDRTMYRVMSGEINHHHGWTFAPNGYKPRKLTDEATHHGFVSPTGEPVVIRNLSVFCKENGVSVSAMCRLRRGEHESYKGWTYKPPKLQPA